MTWAAPCGAVLEISTGNCQQVLISICRFALVHNSPHPGVSRRVRQQPTQVKPERTSSTVFLSHALVGFPSVKSRLFVDAFAALLGWLACCRQQRSEGSRRQDVAAFKVGCELANSRGRRALVATASTAPEGRRQDLGAGPGCTGTPTQKCQNVKPRLHAESVVANARDTYG